MPGAPVALGDLAQVLSGAAAAATFLVGGVVGLRRYRHGLKIKAAELLLRLEEEFRSIHPTLVAWDVPGSYDKAIRPLIRRYMARAPLADEELRDLAALDRALRFFYLCTVLHTDLRIEQAVLARSYYWYASQLLDRDERPELYAYVEKYFQRLHRWLVCHERCFRHYGRTGAWKPRLAMSYEEALRRRARPPGGGTRRDVSGPGAAPRRPDAPARPGSDVPSDG